MKSSPIVSASERLLQTNGSIIGSDVAKAILPIFPSLLSAFPLNTNRPALASVDGRKSIEHERIHDFILEVGDQLKRLHVGRGHRVAVVLPNGPELALAILVVSTWACCVPMNANGALEELEKDLIASGCDVLIGMENDTIIPGLSRKIGIPFCGLVPNTTYAGLFTLRPSKEALNVEPPKTKTTKMSDEERFLPNSHEDEILVLFTSGTTGSKKLVPHLLGDVLIATACISVSWKLTPQDTNCNLMPLFHVGGIIRQVFSPILSGGCVICCPSFDPNIFWNLLKEGQFTWYYAAPTMHHMILQAGKQEGFIKEDGTLTTPKLRMIANAAGGLLPSLARELRNVFKANVLPSYGMTECMPISSPPATYELGKPGTSGVAVGPEVEILNTVTAKPLSRGEEGPICVRGQPCFRGYGLIYGQSESERPQSFLKDGWFNTGDLGYMDEDGYLYITGRSKEVINRGGEIISPLEVEEAVNSHPDIAQSVAFSTEHNVLQEVVGIVVVMKPNRPRIDLPSLHEYLSLHLAAAKWPQCIVYMEGVPKSHTNKLLRVKLGERMSIPELSDDMPWIERTFDAICPKHGTEVHVPIDCGRVAVDAQKVETILKAELVKGRNQELVVASHPSKPGSLVAYVLNISKMDVIKASKEKLDGYLIPSHVCSLQSTSALKGPLPLPVPSDSITSIQTEAKYANRQMDPLVVEVQKLFRDMLNLESLPSPDGNFFNLGGSSMLASQLASKVRKNYGVSFGGAEVFQFNNCEVIAECIRDRQRKSASTPETSASSDDGVDNYDFSKLGLAKTGFDLQPRATPIAWIMQLLPIFFFYPVWQISRFLLFFRLLLAFLNNMPNYHHLVPFMVSIILFHSLWLTITPLIFVVIKWTVIGRYEKGRYQIWGQMYLRWWLVDVLRKLVGKGIWGSRESFLNFYYRLLGAHIGKNAKISLDADIAEYDLVYIGENAAVDYSVVRGFGVDGGAMLLGPVRVGNRASVGARSIVAPCTSVPDNQHLGPSSSSYDVPATNATVGAALKHRSYNRQALPKPNEFWQIFVCRPILFVVDTFSHLPSLLILFFMVRNVWHGQEPLSDANDLLKWLCNLERIPYFLGIRLSRALITPIVYMALGIIVKRVIIGKFQEGPRDTNSQWQLSKFFLAEKLFSREKIQDVTELIGRHYELVSIMYRLLGAKVGKRVFWPGRQPITTGQFDLLEIGDDVVFGSRSAIFTATVTSYEKVILCAGANCSDNTVVLPGSVIGKNAVLGSNSVCPAGRYLPEESVWFGARGGEPVMLEKGVDVEGEGLMLAKEVKRDRLQMKGDKSTLRPFGKAFYLREASYEVFSLQFLVAFSFVTKAFNILIHTTPLLAALHLTAGQLYGFSLFERDYYLYDTSFSGMYYVVLSFFCLTNALRVFLWLFVEISSKWMIMGRRQPGRYNYDECDYAQRWELYQLIAKIRSVGRMNLMDFLGGTPYMSLFYRALGSKVGKDCCLYPAGADPFMPEPDLVEFGDRCVIDCSSIVCHLNTRGNFELRSIKLEDNVTLRSRSRVQQGVVAEQGSMLLEKSLAMTGEVIDGNSVWQGSPASHIYSYDVSVHDGKPTYGSISMIV